MVETVRIIQRVSNQAQFNNIDRNKYVNLIKKNK